jgi:2'-5' RNA ligase
MARYVVVLPLAPLEVGDEFTVADWPLHLTLVEPFETGTPAGKLAGALSRIARTAHPIGAAAGEAAMFGARRDVPVSLIRDGGEVRMLREHALAVLAPLGLDPGRVRPDFRPHVTAKHHGRLHPGDRVRFDRLALIDMRPSTGAHHREVVGVARLSGSAPQAPSALPDPVIPQE